MRLFTSITIFIALSTGTIAQPADTLGQKGLRFEVDVSWDQALKNAATEKKYIFLDCYTTWCGPCKQMEKDVYPLEKVGTFINQHFICLKLQMDTSKKDDALIKRRYRDAEFIRNRFNVTAYPTFLYFDPDGKIVERVSGARPPEDFIRVAQFALNNDYYAELADFQKGERKPQEMYHLAVIALELGDTTSSYRIAKEYVGALSLDSLYSRKNLKFISEFTRSGNDPGFNFFYKNSDSINRIIGVENYAQQLIQSIIYSEMIMPRVYGATGGFHTNPDWDKLSVDIGHRYNEYYAHRTICAARATWARKQGNWPEYTKYLVQFIDMVGPMVDTSKADQIAFVYNNLAWQVFLYSTDKEELNKALSWSSHAVMADPEAAWMDTYANILYKLGQTALALRWESIATSQGQGNDEIRTNFDKMKKGQATWYNY